MPDRFVWQQYLGGELRFDPTYHEVPRTDIVSFINEPPGTVLDVGCAGGATGRLIKTKFPGTRVIGIELNAGAADHARQHLDKVLARDFETLDPAADLAGEEIGTVMLLDVLEHLIDPWRALVRLRQMIDPRTRILASIPNVRNLATLHALAAGDWEYRASGVLDITHLRFFTAGEIRKLFQQTGYDVRAMEPLTHPELMESIAIGHRQNSVETERVSIKYQSTEDLEGLYAIQYVVDARALA